MRLRLLASLGAVLLNPAFGQTADPQVTLQDALWYSRLYNWAEAAPLFEAAERGFTDRGDTANTLMARLGRIRSTMEQLSLPEAAEEIQTELDQNPVLQTDKRARLFALIVKADITGELDAAPMRRDWEAVLSMARELGDSQWENRASGEIGFTAFLEGDLTRARQMVAAALLRATELNDVGAQIRYLSAIGTGMAVNGGSEQALPYFEKAERLASLHPETGYQYLIYAGRLQALRALGQLESAERLARDMIERATQGKRNVKRCQVLITAAGVSAAMKDTQTAITRLKEAIDLASSGGFLRLLASAQYDLADVYRQLGQLEEAEKQAIAAAEASRSGGETYLQPKRLLALAELQASRGKFPQADETYERAEYLIDGMLGGVSNAQARGALIRAMSAVFAKHFALIAERFDDPARAFQVLERARGRVATDLLATGAVPGTNEDVRVDRRIAQLRLKLVKVSAAAEGRRLRDAIFMAEQARWLGGEAPQLRSAGVDAIRLDDVRNALRSDEVLIEYVLASPQSYALAITREKARIVRLPSRERVEELAADAQIAIRKRTAAVAAGRRLHETLLGSLPEVAGKRRVIVIRDGQLHLISFDFLVDPSGRYLLARHNVSYAPSGSAFVLLRSQPPARDATRMLLAVGDVPYQKSSAVPKAALTRGFSAGGLMPLPASRDEVMLASGAVKSATNTILLGSPATESAVKSQAARYRIAHFAVHGISNDKHPESAALLLMSDPAAGEDGILQASEITRLKTTADVVVLSACDTAVGQLLGEEGIANLSRAFLLSGARTVISTLWSVDDTFSLALMRGFYQRLRTGQTAADALAGAKREIIRQFGSRAVPYYWAGFTLEGSTETAATPVRAGRL